MGIQAVEAHVIPVWPVGGSIAQQQRAKDLEKAITGSQLALALANRPPLPFAMLHSSHSLTLHSTQLPGSSGSSP